MVVRRFVGVRVGSIRRLAEAGGAADYRLVERLPETRRPHEGLVVEARRDRLSGEAVNRHQVERERGPAVLASRDESVEELDLRRLRVRRRAAAFAEFDERVRLLRASGQDSARPVIFEAAADEAHAVGDQRGSERVSGMADECLPVEAEPERLASIDEAALRKTPAAHAPARGATGGADGGANLVGQRVALDLQPLPAACVVVPPFGVPAARVRPRIDIIVEGLLARVRRWALHRCVAAVLEFVLGPHAAEGTGNELHGFYCAQGLGARAALVDETAFAETVDREVGVDRVRLVRGDHMGEAPARAGNRLEAAVAPAAVEIEPLDRRLADEGRAVHGHVHDARPLPENAQARERRHHRDRRAHQVLDQRKIAALRIGIVAVEVAAEYEAALVGLADVEMASPERRNAVDIGLDRFRHEGLQKMRLDRQGEARHGGEPRGIAGDRDAHLARADEAARCLDADHSSGLAADAGHLAMFENVDAAPVGRPSETPDHRVVPRRAAARLQEPADDGEHRIVHRSHRQHGAYAFTVQKLCVDALKTHRIAAPHRGVPLGVRMEDVEDAPLAHHHIVVEVMLQPFPQLQRLLVEARIARQHVVRADDRRVAAAVAEADRPLLHHRDIDDPVQAREIVGGREAVAAAADDDDVVSRLGLGLAPGGLPARVAAKRFREKSPAGIVGRSWIQAASTGVALSDGVQPFRSRQPGARLPKRDRRKVERSVKRHSPSVTISAIALPLAGRQAEADARHRGDGDVGGCRQAIDHRPAVRRVLDDPGPGADDAGVGGLREKARRGAWRRCAQSGVEGFGASDPSRRPRAIRAGRRHRRDCRAASGGRRGRCRRFRRSASAAAARSRSSPPAPARAAFGRRAGRAARRSAAPRRRRVRRRRNPPRSVSTARTLPPASASPSPRRAAGCGRRGRERPGVGLHGSLRIGVAAEGE